MSLSIAQNTLIRSACLLLCAIPSIIAVVTLQNGVIGDGPEYHQIAVNLLQRHVFSEAHVIPYEPTVFRSPGYPGFLAAIYAFTRQSTGAVRMVQLLLFWLSAWGTGRIAARLFSPLAGFIATCLTLLYLPLVSYVPIHMTELLSACLLIWALWLFLWLDDEGFPWRSMLCGLTLASLALVRPTYVLLIVFLLPFLPWKNSPRRTWRNACCMLLLFATPICLWIVRNSLIAKRPVGLTAGMGVILYESAMQYSGRISYKRTTSEWQAIHAAEHAQEQEVFQKTPSSDGSQAPRNIRYELAIDREFREEAARMFHRDGIPHPFTNLLKRMSYLWAPSDLFTGWQHAISQGEHMLFVAFVVNGAWLLKRRPRILLLLFLPALYTTVLHLVFQVEGRYSLPARLPLMVVAAYALACHRGIGLKSGPLPELQAASKIRGTRDSQMSVQ
jgi:hypothetical protein